LQEPVLPTDSERGVALVTGGAVRVGRAISEALAAAGYHVAVNYLESESAATEVVETIRAAGGIATAFRADVTDGDACRDLVERSSGLGPISVLVNNAALFERRAFLDLDDDIWQRHMRLNLEAPYRLSLLVGRRMWEAGSGRIVNICGTVGIEPRGEYGPYCVAKRGLDELTRCCAEALAPRVQVNGIAPGAILFPRGTDAAEQRRILGRVPAGRVGSPEDIAAVVRFLISAPDYVTGTVLPVDGGVSVHNS
jgi:NAD(P)-dependent dehydrogenase (short-subunit alcohol dehydrogenase family)